MPRWLIAVRRAFLAAVVAIGAVAGGADVIERGGIRIEFPPQARSLAEQSVSTLELARDAYRDRLSKSPGQLDVVICSTNDDFRKYAGSLATRSVLGIAKPEQDLIVLKAPLLAPAGSDFRGTVRHELIHVLLRHNVNTDNLPRWLNEGVAMVLSGEHRWNSRATVASMYLNGRILSYRNLEASFLDPGSEFEFGDAYAQAYSMTQYLIGQLGEDRFWELLYSLDARTFGAAIEDELGQIPHDFWVAWKGSLGWTALVFSLVSGFSVFQIMALLTVLAYWRKWRRGRAVIRQWEEEDVLAETPGDVDGR